VLPAIKNAPNAKINFVTNVPKVSKMSKMLYVMYVIKYFVVTVWIMSPHAIYVLKMYVKIALQNAYVEIIFAIRVL